MESPVDDETSSNSFKESESVLFCRLPDPPSTVAAIGRHESAEIWWTKDYGLDKGTEILQWEVTRYRKDTNDGKETWSNKGSMTLLQLGRIHQCIFFGLKSHCEYRFTITIKTAEGYSSESAPSNMVYIDAPPPVGWKLCHDQSSRKYYYFNDCFRFSQYSRPENDPYFIEHCIAKLFSRREINKFKEVWAEEMMHFEEMTNVRLKRVLSELGEEVSAVSIRDHMKAFVNSETSIVTFKGFMDILHRVKRDMMEAGRVAKKEKSRKNHASYDMGDWNAKYDKYSQRWCYSNAKALFGITSTWDMTWEARFYISEEDLYEVHEVFDFGMVERIRAQFDEVNLSKTGLVSREEFDMFLVAVNAVTAKDNKKRGLQISTIDRVLINDFFYSIDDNRNGFIAFNEFCMMMCHLLDKKKKGDMINKIRSFDYLNVLADSGPVKIPLPPSKYVEQLHKKREKTALLKRIADKDKQNATDEKKRRKRRRRRSRQSRKIHYSVSDEFKGQGDFDDINAGDLGVASGYVHDEELDELRARAPPHPPSCAPLLSAFPFLAEYISNMLQTLNISRRGGPHGVFCLCGCRSEVSVSQHNY